jgi:3-oxoisoapionate decarboxylase
MKLGVDTYSLRRQGWTPLQHLEHAHSLGLDVVQFSERSFFASLDEDYLRPIKARADALGLEVNVGMLSICPTSTVFSNEHGTAVEQLQAMLQAAELFESPVVRCVMGTFEDRRSGTPLAVHLEHTLETLRAVREQALDLGVKIAIETHAGDLGGRVLAELIREAGPELVGACPDAGGVFWSAESPFVTLEYLAPYVVTSHVRDTVVWKDPAGARALSVAMGEGNVHIEEWARLFEAKCPSASFTLEIITGSPPRLVNYAEPEFWQAYPETLPGDLAQFEQLAKAGEPYTGGMLIAPEGAMTAECEKALAEQERADLERSVRYCQEVLGIGERGRTGKS